MESIPEDTVILKPLFGLRPGVYLTIFYSFVLLIILALVLIVPGIRNNGTQVTFTSEPWGAAVRVDAVFKGTTPCTLFIPKGTRHIEFVLPGFKTTSIEQNFKGRVFASLIFPRKEQLSVQLVSAKPLDSFRLGAASFTEWALTGEASAIYQHPRSLSEAVYRIGNAIDDTANYTALEQGLEAASRFAYTQSAARDLVRARFLLSSSGNAASPFALTNALNEILGYLNANPGAAYWLSGLLDGSALEQLQASSWYKNQLYRAQALYANSKVQPASGNAIRIGPLNFLEIPGGEVLTAAAFPTVGILDSFWISDALVTAGAWDLFTRENPEWSEDNRDSLIENGLVGEDYLRNAEFPEYPEEAATGISWYAADAFCSWLGKQLPVSMQAYEVRLPSEAEWEQFIRSTGQQEEYFSSGLWEWCVDPYAPLNFLAADNAAISYLDSPERSLRGGSWINPEGTISFETRAFLPPSMSSFFTGFRPVIAIREEKH